MGNYMLFSQSHSHIESDPISYITERLSEQTAPNASMFHPAAELCLPAYDQHAPPEHPYTRAPSSYSPVVQLYSRSTQLDTKLTRFLRFGDCSPLCSFGCPAFESSCHLFVACPRFQQFRTSFEKQNVDDTEKLMRNNPVLSASERDRILSLPQQLFRQQNPAQICASTINAWPVGLYGTLTITGPPRFDNDGRS
ncbi:hypothetical protein V5O48_014647 [Marasmius crinis-equi]|uniref:Uncharacterized protein n=1 Tax=Marasmius crinis-equi TaxID=585013 RepID=A0ABR3EX28_9AGAR